MVLRSEELCDDMSVQLGGARVVELRRHGLEHRQFGVVGTEPIVVAAKLLPDVSERIVGALPVRLVDDDGVGEVDHVDLLELARRPVLGGHDVDRPIRQIDDLRSGLAAAGRLDDDEVEAGELAHGDRSFQRSRDSDICRPRGHRPHVHPRMREHVHADSVAQQCPATAPTGRVDRKDGDRPLLVAEHESPDQLIGER